MKRLREALDGSPLIARVAPFVIFVSLTAMQGKYGLSYYGVYCAKTFVGAFLIWLMWPLVKEMRWAFSWEAVVIGVFVAVFWVGIDPWCPKWMKIDHVWNPHVDLGANSTMALAYIT